MALHAHVTPHRQGRAWRALALCFALLVVASAGPAVRAVLLGESQSGEASVALDGPPDFPFTYSAVVAQMIAGVRTCDVYSQTAYLSGDWPVMVGGGSVTLQTRNGLSEEYTRQATQYVYEFMRAQDLAVSYHAWSDAREGVSGRNVIAVITGTCRPDELVLITAHLDDMPEGGPAPGADDNASGSAGVMLAASSLAGHAFERTVRLVLFTGEEYGLLGSAAYAAQCRARNENIVALLNLDMIGWDGNDDGRVILGTRYEADGPGYAHDLAIANVFSQVLSSYGNGELHTAIDPSQDPGVDNTPFWDLGYPGVLAIEDYDLEWNPHYHTPGDTLLTLNLRFFTCFVQTVVGTAAHLALPHAVAPPTGSATPSPVATPTRTATPQPTATWTPLPSAPPTPTSMPGPCVSYLPVVGGRHGQLWDDSASYTQPSARAGLSGS